MVKHAYDERAIVQHWREGAVAHLRFNHAEQRNAIDVQFAAAFSRACQAIADDPEVRAVWISGEGRAFMVGGDLASMRGNARAVAERLIAGMHGGLRLLAGLRAPVVASVHGAVAGGGLGVMLAADLVVAADNTRLSFAYPGIGASCDCGASWALPRAVGLNKALEIALLGPTLDAAQALQIGLVNRVVPEADLQAETRRLVERLANGPTRAYGRIRQLMRGAFDNELGAQLDAENDGFLECADTKDFAEGVEAFFHKRAPVFTGQ
ncbi:enoyl-CoA hydratase-related protein [Ramlibacter sp. WS9]|uniref:enoyl-CoA hydratase-related protein n=1 Tax=Ramlibacter sp. WS9 TaxID=1882741 RepID=UPI001E39EF61|nr:enoyl-CoA hydratase-related protein [Ramlibacter sp. WS9]